MVGKNDYDLFPKEQADSFTKIDREVFKKKHPVDIPEEPVYTKRLGRRILHTKKIPIHDGEGKEIYLLGISEDITERKQTEETLEHTLEKLRRSLAGTIRAISLTVETRDPYISGHQKGVSRLARAIAQEMGVPDDIVDTIRMAGAVHDIGKISVPAEILSKPGKLSDIEFSIIKTHSQSGYDILRGAGLPDLIAEIVLQHHERLDGSGYPQGLKGGQILLESQIIAVADVVEAMASHRPYRPTLSVEVALKEIEKNKDILYNPAVVDICLVLFREKGFTLEQLR
jgi:putative nucleotidyltransferase with HDIG domain